MIVWRASANNDKWQLAKERAKLLRIRRCNRLKAP
jgi:hypothetical protein